ncbi:hypothetical protein GN958_ATG12036 [Phytophthora infestans]|uniref:Uncharacterized protein n=1 Tax=Phytophthora infestans TaxID=4787 RepID=A0A8S9UH95_PHYIN|nr:hypothetical protein GN958_ATG12036 [Phytophthora infestans]
MEKLLSNPNFRTFMGFIDDYNVQNPGNGATVIKSVTATYGDDVAAAVLQRATKVSATKVTAEKLLGDLRVLWLTDKRSPLDVFKLLKLDDVATNPLDNAALDAWESYLNLFNYVNRESGKKITELETFRAAYGGDDALAKMLQQATKVSATKVNAEKLLGDLRVLWLTDKRSPLDVFKLLKLDDVATNPLDNAALDAWESYLNLFNYVNRESGKKITELETFRAAYGGDDALAKMLHQAARVSTTKEAARNLLRDQRNRWWGEKRTPLDVFKLLNLDKVASNPLASPALDVWNSYLKSFNYWSRGTGRETTTIDTFTAAYGDAALAKIINTARTVPETEKMATALQLQQFALWMRKRGNPNNIYTHVFKLDPKLKTIPEPYQTILNHYHSFYKQFIRDVK